MAFCATGGFEKVLLGFIALKQDHGDYPAHMATQSKKESFVKKSNVDAFGIRSTWRNLNCIKRWKVFQTGSSFVYNLDEKLKVSLVYKTPGSSTVNEKSKSSGGNNSW